MFFGFCLTNKGEAVWTICWKVVAKGGNTSKWIFFYFLVTSKKQQMPVLQRKCMESGC